MNVVLLIPGHIKCENHVKMLHEKEQLRINIRQKLDPSIKFQMVYSIDRLQNVNVDVRSSKFDRIINLLERSSNGIVFPTRAAIKYAYSYFGPNCLFIRLGQDVTVQVDKLVQRIIQCKSTLNDKYMMGAFDQDGRFFRWFKDEDPRKKETQKLRWRFIQGNFMIAPIKVWNKYYFSIPEHINHYADDSMVSWLIKNDGGKLIEIPRIWHHYKNNSQWLKSGVGHRV